MRGKAIAMTGVFGAALTLAATAAVAQPGARPVRYGLNGPELDGCTPYSEISGLNPRGDNFVSVRAAPTTAGRELDRLGPGRKVWICEEAGGWAGIVYGPRASTGCNVETPIPRVRAYRGPCRSGWVSSRYVTPIAG
jgi:hypothetical protein